MGVLACYRSKNSRLPRCSNFDFTLLSKFFFLCITFPPKAKLSPNTAAPRRRFDSRMRVTPSFCLRPILPKKHTHTQTDAKQSISSPELHSIPPLPKSNDSTNREHCESPLRRNSPRVSLVAHPRGATRTHDCEPGAFSGCPCQTRRATHGRSMPS